MHHKNYETNPRMASPPVYGQVYRSCSLQAGSCRPNLKTLPPRTQLRENIIAVE